jgi:hypothetical protein
MADFGSFLFSLATHWVGWVTGSAVTVVFFVYERLRKEPPRWLVLAGMLVAGFCASAFLAWEDEHRLHAGADATAEELRSQLKTAQQQINAQSLPKLAAIPESLSIIPYSNPVLPNYRTAVILTLRIIDIGAPSITTDWTANIRIGGKDYAGAPLMPHDPFTLKVSTGTLVLHRRDLIQAKTAETPISRGGGKSGWLLAVFPFDEKVVGRGVFQWSFKDVLGEAHPYAYRFDLSRPNDLPLYPPGLVP